MRRQGPYLTLLAGVLLALVLGVLDVRANSDDSAAEASPSPAAESAQPTESATPTPSASSSEPATPVDAPARADYAGRTEGRAATVAIAVRDGRAIAYVCDGRRAEAWLEGTATDGQLTLSRPGGDKLTAQLGGGKATGTAVLGTHSWAFSVPVVQKPNGLYRANATVGGVRFRGGWIVLPDGQTGVATGNGKPGPAPLLDPGAGAVSIDGTEVPVVPVSGVTEGYL